jgi:hypothetical protein
MKELAAVLARRLPKLESKVQACHEKQFDDVNR